MFNSNDFGSVCVVESHVGRLAKIQFLEILNKQKTGEFLFSFFLLQFDVEKYNTFLFIFYKSVIFAIFVIPVSSGTGVAVFDAHVNILLQLQTQISSENIYKKSQETFFSVLLIYIFNSKNNNLKIISPTLPPNDQVCKKNLLLTIQLKSKTV